MNLNQNELKALTRLKTFLQNQESFVDLLVFGSKVLSLSTSESDIDILIIFREFDHDLQALIDDFIFELNLEYDCLMSVVIFSLDELESGPMSESPLYKSAMQQGIRV
ncbi:MAG: nucleotidyltransferase domain-containing protein [Desulfovermiculus sp.]|nr:nucleotidyltransferase domain-containing protein [Desulfovermiculus sp.]